MNDILDVLVETFTLDGPVRRFTHIRFCKLNTCITNVLTNRFSPFRSLLLYRLQPTFCLTVSWHIVEKHPVLQRLLLT